MALDAFSLEKRCLPVGETRIAYRDDGAGPVVVLLHGCPFSSFVWRRVELLPNTGHLLMEEAPERVSELLADFLTPAA